MDKINGVINFEDTNGLGSVERLAIASDALNRGFGWKLGQGLGAWNIMGGKVCWIFAFWSEFCWIFYLPNGNMGLSDYNSSLHVFHVLYV